MTDARLERSYRRLMLAYPARYRRRYARELVTTLLEMSSPGQRRAPLADVWLLLVAGLRQRFRLPARRPLPWVAALLTTLVLGALGAAAGSLAAEQTTADLPGRAWFTATARLTGDGTDWFVTRQSSPHAATGWLGAFESTTWTPESARERLAAAGWHLTTVRRMQDGGSYVVGPATGGQPISGHLTGTAFDATRGGLHLRVLGWARTGHSSVSTMVWPADNGARWPLTLAGLLLGLALGWPPAATVAFRLRRAPARRARAAATLYGLALTALLAPALACYANLGLMVRAAGAPEAPVTVHSALSAGPFENFGWRWALLQLAAAGLVLALAATGLAATGGREQPEPVPAAD